MSERISGWAQPNGNNAARLIDQFVEQSTYDEDELYFGEVWDKLEEYRPLSRDDFESGEKHSEART